MRSQAVVTLALLVVGCTTPLEQGERLYHEGDRLGALETWRAVPEEASDHDEVRERIRVVEAEFQRLVVQYKQRGRYYEGKERLAESILNYRLALKLQPDDAETLDHVQTLARKLASRKAARKTRYRDAFEASDLPEARRQLATLRTLDPFDPEIETDERQLHEALRAEVGRRMGTGRRGFAAGNYDGSTAAFQSVLELDPDNESARGYLSYIATLRRESEAAGNDPVAFEDPGSFKSDDEIRAEGFYQNALAAERKGELYAAIRNDLHALQADPAHEAAKRQLSLLRRRLAPEVDTLIEAGRTAFREEDLQSALDLWRQALLVDPRNERVIAYVGRAEQQIQNLERMRSEPDVSSGGK
jgi:tetratricopeptide (TPR) repeat protein